MGDTPSTGLVAPPKADTLDKNFMFKFERGSQAASATALVVLDDDMEVEQQNRVTAEGIARAAAEQKYQEEFGEPVDWPAANVLVSHTSFEVIVYVNVRV